jgi:Helix-loop-helix DNA-binding domain
MKLGRLGHNNRLAAAPAKESTTPKAEQRSTRPKTAPDNARQKLPRRGTVSASPNLKAILPGDEYPSPFPWHFADVSKHTAVNKPLSPSSVSTPATGPTPQPVVQIRKTSHKAAEQKRRDSLKTTFDDLRGLLPPIPLPSEEGFPPDERILPGALPPRGPPKAGGEGPNKGVSKLQLLMCGNEFIRQLKARVERRDDEITILRREVRKLRIQRQMLGGLDEDEDGEGELDLERDLDAVEGFGTGLLGGRGSSIVADDEADEDMGE